jgi:hypothetical protein
MPTLQSGYPTLPEIDRGIRAPMPAYQWRPGQTIFTNFSNEDRLYTDFNVSNFTLTTDGSTTIATPTWTLNNSHVVTQVRSRRTFTNFLMRCKVKQTNTADLRAIQFEMRYANSSNMLVMILNGSALYTSEVRSIFSGATVNSSGVALPDSMATTASYYRIAAMCIEDVLRWKVWIDGTPEPDWQGTFRFTGNIQTSGTVGFTTYAFAQKFAEFQVTELVRGDDNLLHNADFLITDPTTGLPAWWEKFTADSGVMTQSVVDVADRFGQTRKALKIVKPSGTTLPGWKQILYNLDQIGANNWTSRSVNYPSSRFPSWVECSVWTKATNVANTDPVNGHSALWNNRYLDWDNTTSEFANAFYNQDLGPVYRSSVNETKAGRGQGTWGWTLTRWRMQVYAVEHIHNWPVLIHLHDAGCTADEFYIMDPYIRAVS